MDYKVEFTKLAIKSLRKLPEDAREKLINKIEELAKDPFSPFLDIKNMQGRDGYRLRVGDWRAIYELNNHQLQIIVIKIGNRKEVYK